MQRFAEDTLKKTTTAAVLSLSICGIFAVAGEAAPVRIAPVKIAPGVGLPGMQVPNLPLPIERPTWPALPKQVSANTVLPAANLPGVKMPVAPPASFPGVNTPILPDAHLPGVQVPAVVVSHSGVVKKAKWQTPAVHAVSAVRRSFGLKNGNARLTNKRIRAAFDGLKIDDEPTDAVDVRPSELEEGVEDTPSQPLFDSGSRPQTLPEWDLEREIGLRW